MKKKLVLGGQLDLNAAFEGGPIDSSVIYAVPSPQQQSIVSVSPTGVITAVEEGTATVEIKDAMTGRLLRAVVIQVLNATDFSAQDSLEADPTLLDIQVEAYSGGALEMGQDVYYSTSSNLPPLTGTLLYPNNDATNSNPAVLHREDSYAYANELANVDWDTTSPNYLYDMDPTTALVASNSNSDFYDFSQVRENGSLLGFGLKFSNAAVVTRIEFDFTEACSAPIYIQIKGRTPEQNAYFGNYVGNSNAFLNWGLHVIPGSGTVVFVLPEAARDYISSHYIDSLEFSISMSYEDSLATPNNQTRTLHCSAVRIYGTVQEAPPEGVV